MRCAATMHEIAPRSQVLVYEDEGVNMQSSEALVTQLRALLDSAISIQKVGSDYLKTQSWEDKTIALVMGGGKCTPWEKSLEESGMHKIRDYVLGGGKYLGFCAGAYFASAESHFSSLPKKNRPLAFFKGKAKGPLFDTENYHVANEWITLDTLNEHDQRTIFNIEVNVFLNFRVGLGFSY